MLPLVEKHIVDLKPYVPGKTFKEARAEYGIKNFVKLASNENCLGPSPKAVQAMYQAFPRAHLYPNEERDSVEDKICEYHRAYQIKPENIVLGNGSTELIMLLVRALLSRHEILLNAWPSFSMYRTAAQIQNRQELTVQLTEELKYDLKAMIEVSKGRQSEYVKLVFISNPNNPTGAYIAQSEIDNFMAQAPAHLVIVIDEAYAEYAMQLDYTSAINWVLKRPRTVVLRTFSKVFGLAGLRIGYAICDKEIAAALERVRDVFNVNCFSQEAAKGALDDVEHVQLSREHNQRELSKMCNGLNNLGIKTTKSSGNFVLMHLDDGMPLTQTVIDDLLLGGFIVRGVANYDLPRSIRVTIGRTEDNQQFLAALSQVLAK
jgi:histidinol-phosphate aminotransferase